MLVLLLLLGLLSPTPTQGPRLALDCELPDGYEAGDFLVRALPEPLFEDAIAASIQDWPIGTMGRVKRDRGLHAELKGSAGAAVGDPWRVHVLSRDRLYWGTASVRPGDLEKPVALELVRCGRLLLSTTDVVGRLLPGANYVTVLVHEIDPTHRHPARFHEVFHENTIIGPLPAGEYRIEVQAQRMVSEEFHVKVAAGETLQKTVALEELPDLRPLRVVVRNETGARVRFPSVDLWVDEAPSTGFSADAGQSCRFLDASFVEPEFQFLALPPDQYFVRTGAYESLLWPVRTRIDSTQGPLELVNLPPDAPGFRMRVRSSARNAVLRRAWIDSPTNDPLFPLVRLIEPGRLLAAPELAGTAFEWVLTARDHVPLHGDHSAFVPEGKDFVADVVLEKGWGACVWAETVRGDPLSGAQVRGDGTLLGTTDESGHAQVSMPASPETLHVTCEGLRIVDGNVHPTSGRFHRSPRLRVVFAAR